MFLSLDGKSHTALAGRGVVKALRGGQRAVLRVRLHVPSAIGAGPIALVACAGRRCSGPASLNIFYDSPLDRIKRSRALGANQRLIYELEALAGDRRLPKRFRGPSPVQDDNSVIQAALSVLPSLPASQRRLVSSFLIPPRYRGTIWAPRRGRGSVAAEAADNDYGTEGCTFLATSQGRAWSGVPSTHAVVWYANGDAGARARAGQVSGWIEHDIWPKLTKAFKAPMGDHATGCDPAGDDRFDVYLVPVVGRDAEGLTLPLKLGNDSCAPHPAVVLVHPTSSRATVAHEFMHAIQFAYRGYGCRTTLWLTEGMATWAQTFVYPSIKEHHRYRVALSSPFLSLANIDYDSWPFWYWMAKHDGVPALKEILEGLATSSFDAVLDRVPAGGLDAAFRNYAARVYNRAPPIGRGGFPTQSFRQWDGFTATPFAFAALRLSAPVRVAVGWGSLPALSVDFRTISVTEKAIRKVEISNSLASTPRAGVLAFIKLANGEWVYRDISSQSKLELCRDRPHENATEVILAVSNSLPGGRDLGPTSFPVEGKTACSLPAYNGTFSGTYTTDLNNYKVTWSGSARLEVSDPNGGSPPDWPNATYAHYRIVSGSVHAVLNGTRSGAYQDSCTVHGEADFQLSTDATGGEIDVQVGAANPYYYVSLPTRGDESIPYTETGAGCNQQNPEYPLSGVQWAFTPKPLQADSSRHLTANTSWQPFGQGSSHLTSQFSFAPS